MAKCGHGWSRGFKKVTDDGVWKRTVHPLNPYSPLKLAKCGGGWSHVLKQLSMMVYVTEQFLKDVGSLNLLKTIKIFYVLHKCD